MSSQNWFISLPVKAYEHKKCLNFVEYLTCLDEVKTF